jgi:arsenate reductase-like glutaredoxin family protein
VVDAASLTECLLAAPLLIRRPVLEAPERLLIGFSEATYQAAFPR